MRRIRIFSLYVHAYHMDIHIMRISLLLGYPYNRHTPFYTFDIYLVSLLSWTFHPRSIHMARMTAMTSKKAVLGDMFLGGLLDEVAASPSSTTLLPRMVTTSTSLWDKTKTRKKNNDQAWKTFASPRCFEYQSNFDRRLF